MRRLIAPSPRLALALAGILALSSCKGPGPHLEVPTPGAEAYAAVEPAAIAALSPAEVCVAGSLARVDGVPEGLILMSETGGRTWHRAAAEVHDLRRVTFSCLYFADRLRGWVGGIRTEAGGVTRAVIFRTEDGGNRWREVALIQDPKALVSSVHSLRFVSDTDGAAAVTLFDPETNQERVSTFVSDDAGRTWRVAEYRKVGGTPAEDTTLCMIDGRQGFRLTPSPHAGITFVEATASGGADWAPVAELGLGSLPSWY